MAPGSAVGINYQDQVINNCRFYLGTTNLYIVTALSDDGMSHPHPWAAYVLKTDFDKQTCVLSAVGNTKQEAFTKLHDASARQVQSYIHANGFQSVRHDNKTEGKHDKVIMPDPPESSSESDDEDNMSDASTASTHSRSSSAFGRPVTMPILTPPTPMTMDSSRIPCPSPARIVTHKCSVPLMSMNTNMNSLNNLNNHSLNNINMNPLPLPTQQKVAPVPPPPGWSIRRNLAIPARPCHGNATNVPPPPPPPPPPAVRMAQPASAAASASATHIVPIPPPAAYPYPPANSGLMRPVIFTLRSSVYGELMALDKCTLDYGLVLVRVCDILMERFQDFSNAPVVVPSRHKIRRMSLQIESVTVNGEKYVIGKSTRDLSALPLGLASKTVGVVVSVEKGDS